MKSMLHILFLVLVMTAVGCGGSSNKDDDDANTGDSGGVIIGDNTDNSGDGDGDNSGNDGSGDGGDAGGDTGGGDTDGGDTVADTSAVTLLGSVSSFPDASRSTRAAAAQRSAALPVAQYHTVNARAGAREGGQSLSRADMVPAQALVSLFLLTDVDYANPVATVKTDTQGQYTVRANDVRPFLLRQNLIDAQATEDQVIAAFRALGQLQVRALVVKEENGQRRALAIQSIADPANVNAQTGQPEPVVVDPIVHRITKTIVDQIKSSISS